MKQCNCHKPEVLSFLIGTTHQGKVFVSMSLRHPKMIGPSWMEYITTWQDGRVFESESDAWKFYETQVRPHVD